jgi:hypothetical protein
VDQITGNLYVPFLHFSNADQDFIQMLISDDAGDTFRFATFNIPGAPDATVMPVTPRVNLPLAAAPISGLPSMEPRIPAPAVSVSRDMLTPLA